MKTRLTLFLSLAAILTLISQNVFGWGFWAHREIHRYAIQSLPADMQPFFAENADTLIARAVEPDNRRYSDPTEAPHHYIDIDRYGVYPFDELPRSQDEAVKKFGKATVDSNGTVPWRIVDFTRKLSNAMKQNDRRGILFFASNLGHYIADAHVPLHTTENYDGQLSNQKGIHSRWESRLPEKFGPQYSLGAESVEYINDPLAYAFDIVLESFRLKDSVLSLDLEVRKEIPSADLMKTVERRGRTEHEFSEQYFQLYHKKLNGMVERRMKDAVRRVASYWYMAWVDAGKPDLALRSK
ncbi:MAG: zinc dependent phospholipase C family protein [Bacteroidota bacterium]